MTIDIDHIVAEHQQGLYRLCRGYAGSTEEARDLVQDVLLRVWQHRASFRGEASAKTWVYRIAVNTCLLHRRQRRLPTVSLEMAAEPAVTDGTSEREEQLQRLQRAIRALPPADRLLVLLHLEENSYAEIAAVMGLSVSNVGARLTRVRRKLSDQLKTTESWTN